MKYARFWHSATRLREYFCVAGGFSVDKVTDSVELYDPSKNEWTQSASMNKSRSNFAITQINESLYVMGHGLGHGATIERLDPWKPRWVEVCVLQS